MREFVLHTHGICGVLIFVLGMLQIFLPKKGLRHRLLGRLYIVFWFPLIFSGGYLGSWPITALGTLGLYCALTGWRFARLKQMILAPIDKIIVLTGIALVITLLFGGGYLFILGYVEFGIIISVFCVIFGLFVLTDTREVLFGQKVRQLSNEPMYWFFEHYMRMYVSMITALTAFSALQQPFPSQLANWLWPTAFGTVAIIALGQFYRKKFGIINK